MAAWRREITLFEAGVPADRVEEASHALEAARTELVRGQGPGYREGATAIDDESFAVALRDLIRHWVGGHAELWESALWDPQMRAWHIREIPIYAYSDGDSAFARGEWHFVQE
jgi:hypothetical protein